MEAPVKAARTATRRQQWTRDHHGDVIRQVDEDGHHRYGSWWECRRDGRQLAEANDQGLLMDELERNFR